MTKHDRNHSAAVVARALCPVASLADQAEATLLARSAAEQLVDSRNGAHTRMADDLLYHHLQRLSVQIAAARANTLAGAAAQTVIAMSLVEEMYDSHIGEDPRVHEIIGLLRLALHSVSAVVYSEAGVSREELLPTYFMPTANDPHLALATSLQSAEASDFALPNKL